VQLILLSQFLIGVLLEDLGISSLSSSDLFLLLRFCYFFRFQFSLAQSLGSLLTVTSTPAFSIQLAEGTQFSTNTFFGSLATLKFTSLFYLVLVLLVMLCLHILESLFLATLEGFTLGFRLVS